jgi:hypothetical protein
MVMDTLTLTDVMAAPPAPGESYASIHAMAAWATLQMGLRQPDVVLTHPGADVPYLQRWWIIPRNAHFNVYLHRFLRSDDERALHDHPWPNVSWLIEGEYLEHTPEGTFRRTPGALVEREATSSHRIELIEGQPVTSLFFTGPKEREWGFHCERGWVHWQEFLGSYDGSQPGKGCAA